MEDGSPEWVVVGQLDAVGEQPVVGGERRQARYGPGILGTLGDVDVHSDPVLGGQLGGGVQGVVGAGEGGVDTDHAPSTIGQEPPVLLQAAPGALVPWRSVTP